jgi:hypothetical protein
MNNGTKLFVVTIQKNNMTLKLSVYRSQNNSNKIWLSAWFVALPANQEIPASVMADMLEANLKHGPCHFCYNKQTRQILLTMPVDNRNLSSSELQVCIDTFANVFVATEPVWNTQKWGNTSGVGR